MLLTCGLMGNRKQMRGKKPVTSFTTMPLHVTSLPYKGEGEDKSRHIAWKVDLSYIEIIKVHTSSLASKRDNLRYI
jgi:hypothetical protein